MHRTDAAAVDALHAGGDLVMNVAGFEHGSRLVFPVLWRQSAFDSLLAIPENLGVVSFHSKWPFVSCDCCCDKLNSTSIYGHFELLFCNRSEYHAYNRTRSDEFAGSAATAGAQAAELVLVEGLGELADIDQGVIARNHRGGGDGHQGVDAAMAPAAIAARVVE